MEEAKLRGWRGSLAAWRKGGVEARGWGMGRQTALHASGLWKKKWFLTQPAFSGQNALTNRVSPFSKQGPMAEKGRPSPHSINARNLRGSGVQAGRRAKSDPAICASKGASGGRNLSAGEMEEWGPGFSPGSRGGLHHRPVSEP